MSKPEMKTPEQVIAEQIAASETASKEAVETVKSLEAQVKESVEVTKSLASSLVTLVTDMKAKESTEKSEEFKSLIAEVAFLKEASKGAPKNAHSDQARSELVEKSKKFFTTFKSDIIERAKNGGLFKLDSENTLYDEQGRYRPLTEKATAMTAFDSSSAGAFVGPRTILGERDINLITINPVTGRVANVGAGARINGEVGWNIFDDTVVEIFQANEGSTTKTSPDSVRGEINIYLAEYKASLPITDKVIIAAESGQFTQNPIDRFLSALEVRSEKVKAREILNGKGGVVGQSGQAAGQGIMGIFPASQKTGFKGQVIATKVANEFSKQDLLALPAFLKQEYVPGSALLIDRQAFASAYQELAADGHLQVEQFEYDRLTGMIYLKTAFGIIPFILVNTSASLEPSIISQNDGFANYPSFADGSASPIILNGYDTATGANNTGKAIAVLAKWDLFYTLARSSIVKMGYDQSFGNLLRDGFVLAGRIDFAGGDITTAESGVVLYVK